MRFDSPIHILLYLAIMVITVDCHHSTRLSPDLENIIQLLRDYQEVKIGKNACSNMLGNGHPIVLMNLAAEVINSAADQKNPNGYLQYIYFQKEKSSQSLTEKYKLGFRTISQGFVTYAGIEFHSKLEGQAGIQIKKFIMHPNDQVIKKALRINDELDDALPFSCGDLKFIFSHGKSANPKSSSQTKAFLNGLQEQLKHLQKNVVEDIENTTVRDCCRSRFKYSLTYYYVSENSGDTKPDTPVAKDFLPNFFEAIRCSPKGKRILDSVEFFCESDNLNPLKGKLVGLRPTYKVPFSNRLETLEIIGKQAQSSPINASFRKKVNLKLVKTIKAYYFDNGSIALHFIDGSRKPRVIDTFNCGNTLGLRGYSSKDVVSTDDLLGFYGSISNKDGKPIRAFGFVKYA